MSKTQQALTSATDAVEAVKSMETEIEEFALMVFNAGREFMGAGTYLMYDDYEDWKNRGGYFINGKFDMPLKFPAPMEAKSAGTREKELEERLKKIATILSYAVPSSQDITDAWLLAQLSSDVKVITDRLDEELKKPMAALMRANYPQAKETARQKNPYKSGRYAYAWQLGFMYAVEHYAQETLDIAELTERYIKENPNYSDLDLVQYGQSLAHKKDNKEQF